jgi:hypothetical protein
MTYAVAALMLCALGRAHARGWDAAVGLLVLWAVLFALMACAPVTSGPEQLAIRYETFQGLRAAPAELRDGGERLDLFLGVPSEAPATGPFEEVIYCLAENPNKDPLPEMASHGRAGSTAGLSPSRCGTPPHSITSTATWPTRHPGGAGTRRGRCSERLWLPARSGAWGLFYPSQRRTAWPRRGQRPRRKRQLGRRRRPARHRRVPK